MKQVFISKHNKELIILESESRAVQPVFSRLGNFCKTMLSDRKLLKNGGFDKYNFSEMKLKIPKIIVCFRLMEFLNFWQLIIEHLRFTQHFFLPKLSWQLKLPKYMEKVLLASNPEYKLQSNRCS